MRRLLDGIYTTALVLACASMVLIALMVLAQILARVLDRVLVLVGAVPLGLTVPSLSTFGGMLFVAAATLALPATLRAGGHVRVTLLTGRGGPVLRRMQAGFVLVVAIALAGFAAWHSGLQALDSLRFNSVSFGIIRVPLWIPQAVMTAGFALLALALLDELQAILRAQSPAYERAEANRSEGGH
jgi:TRAP-type C4-dicarboxylate transport system permease small subunit